MRSDVVIVGGGIVGLAVAYKLAVARPGLRATVLEKEDRLAAHQTGRNSGVVHSGIYYRPGSLKALTCRDGKAQLEAFCAEHGVPWERCGKVIVATDENERANLPRILTNGEGNGVDCRLIGPEELRELEPHANGVAAIHVPETGIVDYVRMCDRLAAEIESRGGRIVLGARAERFQSRPDGLVVQTTQGDFEAGLMVNCAGLHSDRVARAAGQGGPERIVPFRGEYFQLTPDAEHLCRNLIYPTPTPQFPFLGVHLTRMVTGGVECGPNAVLALAREAYRKTDVNLADLVDTLSFPGFWRLALRHWRHGAGEAWRSASKGAFVSALQRLVPAVEGQHLVPIDPGVRAQAVSRAGALVDDFVLRTGDRTVHVVNAPSPAATASLAIADRVAESLLPHLSASTAAARP